jgi:hypothetical protein
MFSLPDSFEVEAAGIITGDSTVEPTQRGGTKVERRDRAPSRPPNMRHVDQLPVVAEDVRRGI